MQVVPDPDSDHKKQIKSDVSFSSRLSTFGFRGEALSSCCELADVELASRTEGDSVGARVAFDAEGRPTGTRAAPMRRGTTVTVGRLFSRLPVRRKVKGGGSNSFLSSKKK